MTLLPLARVGVALERPSTYFSFALASIVLLIFTMWMTAEITVRFIVGAVVLAAIYLGSSAIRPAHVSQASVQLAAITLATAAVGGYMLLPDRIFFNVITDLLMSMGLPISPQAFSLSIIPETALAAILFTALSIVYLTRYRPAMGFYPASLAVDFPEPGLKGKVGNLVGQLRNDLDLLDRQTDWRATEFVPLDAEVEVFRGDRRSVSVVDLYEGLRRNRDSHLFVVLGDPGAGKSVALRNLARNLLNEVSRTGRIPVYINLKEWRPEKPWTPENPPRAFLVYSNA
jgi:hypothetical protein